MPVFEKHPVPIPVDIFPERLRPIMAVQGPDPRKAVLAAAEVPMPLDTQVACLAFLSRDDDRDLRTRACGALATMDRESLTQATLNSHPGILDALVRVETRSEVLAVYLTNHAVADQTLLYGACELRDQSLLDLIGLNQERMERLPALVEALYLNPATAMGTAQRVIEFAVRQHLPIERIPGFAEISTAMGVGGLAAEPLDQELVQALLTPDAGAEMLASAVADLAEEASFLEANAEAEADTESTEGDPQSGPMSETIHVKVRGMNLPAKIRLAIVGNSTARALLITDRNRVVSDSVLENPGLTLKEVSQFARNKNLPEDIIRKIASKREWVRAYQVKLALLFNPKTPGGAAGRFLRFMRRNDLKALSRSREVSRPVARAAQEEINRREQPSGK
jgi:hypothetical protein